MRYQVKFDDGIYLMEKVGNAIMFSNGKGIKTCRDVEVEYMLDLFNHRGIEYRAV